MKFINNTINFVFPTVINMREYLFRFEETLQPFSTPFTLIPVPDGTPPEIPRIAAISKHGHSSLNITQQSAQITTNYDEVFSSDIEKCWQYIEEKAYQLKNSIYSILNHQFCFTGLTSIVYFDTYEDPVKLISDRFLRIESKPLADLSTRLTYIIEDTYYVNIEIQNARLYEGVHFGNPLSFAGLKETSTFLQVIIDVNDRYAFNIDSTYLSSEDKLKSIFDLSKELVSQKIPKFIDKGVIDL